MAAYTRYDDAGGYIPNELASDSRDMPIETAGVLIQTDCSGETNQENR